LERSRRDSENDTNCDLAGRAQATLRGPAADRPSMAERRLSRQPCRSTHSTPPAFSLHPSRDGCRLDCRVLRSKIKSERSSGSFPRSLWETPEVTTAARRWISEQMSHQTHRHRPNRGPYRRDLRRLPQGLMSNFEISARHTTLEQSSGADLLIVPTLRVEMPSRTLRVQNDAQRHALRAPGAMPESREPEVVGPDRERRTLGYLGLVRHSGFQVTRRRRNRSGVSQIPISAVAAKKRHPPCRFPPRQRKSLAAFLASPLPHPSETPEIQAFQELAR
jgi:hypothetical protein